MRQPCSTFPGGIKEGGKKGRPDRWLYVGGTKAGPAVLRLYPFGGAPNGHKASAKLASVRGASEASGGVKFVMDCRRTGGLPRLEKD